MTTTLPLSPVRRVDGAADGQEEVGTRSPSPSPSPARNLLLYPRHLALPLILARWEPSFPCPPSGTAKPDKASTPPQNLALLPLSSQEASCCQPGGSRRQQDWLGPMTADSAQPGSAPPLHTQLMSPFSTSALGASATFLLPAVLTAWPFWFPACLLGTFGTSRLCCDISHLGGGQGYLYMWRV